METHSSLMPYREWLADAMREVAIRALERVSESGLPGEHHFFITFRTDMPGVTIPGHLRPQFPHVMKVVLQHKFWGLSVDRQAAAFSVGLSFSNVDSLLTVPFAAIIGFADPYERLLLDFTPPETKAPVAAASAPALAVVPRDAEPVYPAREAGKVHTLARPAPALVAVPAGVPVEAAPGAVLDFGAFRRKKTGGGAEPTPA